MRKLGAGTQRQGGATEHPDIQASPDLLRAMVTTFAEALMGAEADAVCGAAYGERSGKRTNIRNGYRRREWDTRAGSISLAIPKLRQGSYFPDWLLERRRRAEAALVTVVATSYLLGVSTRRMEKLVETLGITRLSKCCGHHGHLSRQAAGLSVIGPETPLDRSTVPPRVRALQARSRWFEPTCAHQAKRSQVDAETGLWPPRLTTTEWSFRAAEQLVELGQGIAAGDLINVGVNLLRGRDVRVAKDDLRVTR